MKQALVLTMAVLVVLLVAGGVMAASNVRMSKALSDKTTQYNTLRRTHETLRTQNAQTAEELTAVQAALSEAQAELTRQTQAAQEAGAALTTTQGSEQEARQALSDAAVALDAALGDAETHRARAELLAKEKAQALLDLEAARALLTEAQASAAANAEALRAEEAESSVQAGLALEAQTASEELFAALSLAEGERDMWKQTAEQTAIERDTWKQTAEQAAIERDTWKQSAEQTAIERDTWKQTAEQAAIERDTWQAEAEKRERENQLLQTQLDDAIAQQAVATRENATLTEQVRQLMEIRRSLPGAANAPSTGGLVALPQ